MTNEFVFDSPNQPIYTQQVNTYLAPGTVAPPEASAGKSGFLFVGTATNTSSLGILGGNVIISIQLANPGGSGRTCYVARFTGGIGISLSLLSNFTGSVTLLQGGTLTGPTTVTPANSNFTSAQTSVMTVRSSTSAVSAGTSLQAIPLVGGPFQLSESGRIVVPPGQTLSVQVAGSLSVAGVLTNTINLEWWEA
ncbi:hypothetical protein [Paenibacillus koleovorans]|uniref:hypothetical protein n=1 Tax=Paenibacillus koleovorans TaxID=121608 RepID=UPI000FD81AE5|nr:hypothetical protein [Paenibacillus koleovorans]